MSAEPITQDMIDCWRTNYGLDTRSPEEAARWWHERLGGLAPAGAVAALGLLLAERATLDAAVSAALERIANEPPVNGNELARTRVLMAAAAIRNFKPEGE